MFAYVDERLWPWIVAAVPFRVVSWWSLRKYWYAACDATGVPRVRLHDLRHCTGQWLANAGRDLSSIQSTLRHTNIQMTSRYTKRVAKQEDAKAMGDLLTAAMPKSQSA